MGMPLALALARCTARRKALPQLIAVEIDPAYPIASLRSRTFSHTALQRTPQVSI